MTDRDQRAYGHNSTLRRCRKIRHATREAAEAHADAVALKPYEKPAATLQTYYCPVCAAWHVGHKKRRKKSGAKVAKSQEQSAYETANGTCEVFDLLERLRLPEWERFKANNEKATFLWWQHDTHHVYRRQFGNDQWNLVRALKLCHRFFHEKPAIGRLVGAWAKERKGELDLAAAKERLGGKNPLGLISYDLNQKKLTGRAARVAQALCRRYGL